MFDWVLKTSLLKGVTIPDVTNSLFKQHLLPNKHNKEQQQLLSSSCFYVEYMVLENKAYQFLLFFHFFMKSSILFDECEILIKAATILEKSPSNVGTLFSNKSWFYGEFESAFYVSFGRSFMMFQKPFQNFLMFLIYWISNIVDRKYHWSLVEYHRNQYHNIWVFYLFALNFRPWLIWVCWITCLLYFCVLHAFAACAPSAYLFALLICLVYVLCTSNLQTLSTYHIYVLCAPCSNALLRALKCVKTSY